MMIPLADVRTLKPNGMALGPDGNLYVSDLTEKYIRQITRPNGDPPTVYVQNGKLPAADDPNATVYCATT